MGRQQKLKQQRREKRNSMKIVPLGTLKQAHYTLKNDAGVKIGLGNLVPTGIKFDPDKMEISEEPYREVLLGVASRQPSGERQTGFDIAEMRKSMKVIDKLEAAEGQDSVMLEDAEFELLKTRLEQTRWTMVTREFLKFLDDVINAPTQESKPQEASAPQE